MFSWILADRRAERCCCTTAVASSIARTATTGRNVETGRRHARITPSWKCTASSASTAATYVHSAILPTFHRRSYWLLQVQCTLQVSNTVHRIHCFITVYYCVLPLEPWHHSRALLKRAAGGWKQQSGDAANTDDSAAKGTVESAGTARSTQPDVQVTQM